MSGATALRATPSPIVSTRPRGEWTTYRAGEIVRCPGINSRNGVACGAGMGEVLTGRTVRVRVRGTIDDRATDLIPKCRRCHAEVEVQVSQAP